FADGAPLTRASDLTFTSATGTYQFVMDEHRKTAKLRFGSALLNAEGRPFVRYVLERMPPAVTTISALTQFAGTYVSPDLATSWCFYVLRSSLVLRRRGFYDTVAEPLFRNAFSVGNGGAVFRRDAQ